MKKGAGRLERILSIRLPVREIDTFVYGRSSAGVFSGTRDATTVFQRRKIASSRPVPLSSFPVSVNKMSQTLMPKIFIRGVARATVPVKKRTITTLQFFVVTLKLQCVVLTLYITLQYDWW